MTHEAIETDVSAMPVRPRRRTGKVATHEEMRKIFEETHRALEVAPEVVGEARTK